MVSRVESTSGVFWCDDGDDTTELVTEIGDNPALSNICCTFSSASSCEQVRLIEN